MKHLLRYSCFIFIGLIFIQPIQAQLMLRASIDGIQAGTQSPGHGVMFGKFSTDFKMLTYQITYSKLQGNFTSAHFHFTPTGGVLQPITFNGNTAKGTWLIPDTLLKYFFTNGIYINIHSSVNPSGEIRGNIISTQVLFTIALDSTLEGSHSTASGTGWLRIKEDSVPTLEYNIVFSGLNTSFVGMHIHTKPSGAVVLSLTSPDSGSSRGTWTTYPDSILKLLVQGKLYINVHSAASPGGEIRGTITSSGEIPFVAALDGQQAGTTSAGRGTAWAVLSADLATIRYSVTYAKLQGSFTASHFHTAVGGSVIHPITFTGQNSVGQWTGFTDVNLQDLLRGKVYVNIHSSAAPGGEIRGMFNYYDKIFTTTLDGIQTGSGSPAKGTAWAHLNQYGDSLGYQVTFNGLTDTFTGAHFHIAPAGSIAYALFFSDTATSSGFWLIPRSMVPELIHGNAYVMIHSKTFPAGEIQGSFNSDVGMTLDVFEPSQIILTSFKLEQNYPNPFNPSTTIGYQLTRRGYISLKIYDMLGRSVATLFEGNQPAGQYHIVFDGHTLASGIYFYRLITDNFTQGKKMLLLK